MPQETLPLAVLVLRRPAVTRWGAGELRPSAVLTGLPAAQAPARLGAEGGVETWYLGARDLILWSGDTGHYRDNLASGRPSVWVALRGSDPARCELVALTADPYEGEGLASDPELIVEAVPMPEAVAARLQDFVAAHHVEMPFEKRKRRPADPNAHVARAPRVLPPEQGWIARKGRGLDP